MAWAGTGLIWTLSGGIPSSRALARDIGNNALKSGDFSFVQISDSHMGFNKPANQDVIGTLTAAVNKINALPKQPEFLLHTGDISHLSRPEEFDNVDQILRGANVKDVFFASGEHDVLEDDGKSYLQRYGNNAKGSDTASTIKGCFHRACERNEHEGGRPGVAWLGATRMDGRRRKVPEVQLADCGICARTAVDNLP